MTITTTKTFEAGLTFKTKTEVVIHHERTIALTRLIDSKIWQFLYVNEPEKGPISFMQISRVIDIPDELFVTLAKTQLPNDEDYCGAHY